MKLRYCLFFQCPILHLCFIKHLWLGVSEWCLDGVWMVSGMWNEEILGRTNTKSIGKFSISSQYSNIALSPSTIYCIKTPMSGGVWMVSESVWMMSRLCLRVSEDASIPNLLAKIYIRPWYSNLAFSSSVMYCKRTPMSGGCLGGVCGCLDHI